MQRDESNAVLTPLFIEGLRTGDEISLADYNMLPEGYGRARSGITRPDGYLATPEHLTSVGLGSYAYAGYGDSRSLPVFYEIGTRRYVALGVLSGSGSVVSVPVDPHSIADIAAPSYGAASGYLPNYEQSAGPFQQFLERRGAPSGAALAVTAGLSEVRAEEGASSSLQTRRQLRRQRGSEDLNSSLRRSSGSSRTHRSHRDRPF